jgi:hypothetical protein
MPFFPTPKTNPRTNPGTNRASNKKQGYARLGTLGTGLHGEVHLILRLDNQILEEKQRPVGTTRWNDPLERPDVPLQKSGYLAWKYDGRPVPRVQRQASSCSVGFWNGDREKMGSLQLVRFNGEEGVYICDAAYEG